MSRTRHHDDPVVDDSQHDATLPPPPPPDGSPIADRDRDLVVDDQHRLVDRETPVDRDGLADLGRGEPVDRDPAWFADGDRDGRVGDVVDRDRDGHDDRRERVDRDTDRVMVTDVDRDADRTDVADTDRVLVADADRDVDRDWDDREIAVVRTRSFSVGQLLTLAVGGILLALGVVALLRTGLETPLDENVDEVLGWNHTALLALIEIGVGAVLVLAALRPGGRFLAGAIGVALIGAGIVMAGEPAWTLEHLAAERGFGWLVAAGGAALVVAAIITPRRHQVVTGTPVRDELHRDVH